MRAIQASLETHNLSETDIAIIAQALGLLQEHVPECYVRVMTELDGVYHHPGACSSPTAIACTRGQHGRWANLELLPSQQSGTATCVAIEVAVILHHESLHHTPDQYGRPLDHSCVDCTDTAERASDPIYQYDEALRQYLAQVTGASCTPSTAEVVLKTAAKVGAGAALGYGVVKLLQALFAPPPPPPSPPRRQPAKRRARRG